MLIPNLSSSHRSRSNDIPGFCGHCRFGGFFGIGRSKVGFTGDLQFHGVFGFFEGVIVFLPSLQNIFGDAVKHRIGILDCNECNKLGIFLKNKDYFH